MKSERPNCFVCEQVKQRWEHWYPTKVKWIRWLLCCLGYKRDAIVFILVKEKAGVNTEPLRPDGHLSGCWRYNAQGWEHIDVKNVLDDNEVDDGKKLIDYAFVERCVYAIDKSKQIAVVSWTYLIPSWGETMDRHYTVTTEYRITETEGHFNFVINRIEKSKPKWIHCIRPD
jgi:hypothetical protein